MADTLFVQDTSDTEEAHNQPENLENDSDSDREVPVVTLQEPAIEQALTGMVDVRSSLSLNFQQMILEELLVQDALLILAKGLGLESIVSNLLHIVATPNTSPTITNDDPPKRSLVILLNAHDEENQVISEELAELSWSDGLVRPFIAIQGETVTANRRRRMYLEGGIVSLSSRIFIVDLLSGIVNCNEITGIVALHADRISETSNEAFIITFYRSHNSWGFLKCVTDDPQALLHTAARTSGGSIINPLQVMLRNMRLEKCLLWPRFHINVLSSLNFQGSQSKQDPNLGKVVEIAVSMTESMERLQLALLGTMKALIHEIKRHNPDLTGQSELFADLARGNASSTVNTDIASQDDYSRFLDDLYILQVTSLFQRHWHRISWTTKQLIGDLALMRRLINHLTSHDCVAFYEDIEQVLSEYTDSGKPGGRMNYNGAPWLMLDEATTVISFAKKRVYDIVKRDSQKNGRRKEESYALEEPPKWEQLALILKEIFDERVRRPLAAAGPVLIMCASARMVRQVREFLACKQEDKNGEVSGRKLMLRRFRDYSAWKNSSLKVSEIINKTVKERQEEERARVDGLKAGPNSGDRQTNTTNNNKNSNDLKDNIGNDLMSLSKTFTGDSQNAGNKRRRTRGGSYVAKAAKLHSAKFTREDKDPDTAKIIEQDIIEVVELDDFEDLEAGIDDVIELSPPGGDYIELELLAGTDEIIIEKYDPLTDHNVLHELLPSYIIMYEPDLGFIRRIEVFQAENRAHQLKTYLMYYCASVEEQRYLTKIKKEKESFTKLIREKGQLGKEFVGYNEDLKLLPLKGKKSSASASKKLAAAINANKATRIAGGRLVETTKVPNKKIVVDMREFRSALPNILYRSGFEVIPCVLTVGDYVLSPKICVERKSVPDLIQSFEKGNLYFQCERMLKFYEFAVLLVEFDESKAFSMNPFVEFRAGSGVTGGGFGTVLKNSVSAERSFQNIRVKLIMLLLKFPGLRIIWSPSPYKTAEFFGELKAREDDPNVGLAIRLGQSVIGGSGMNGDDPGSLIGEIQENDSALDLLKSIPGITSANIGTICTHIKSMRDLVNLEEFEISLLIGEENGKKVYNFFKQNIVPQ
ncbi:ssDNA endodeoxyribonuclease [Saccharomycopsis crataegensis]|uniref:SsDNA endodeoxyribonuclease n=1 Tax=Saccharomycopsis crataegensis TaxID=43959 RepID=A0AAV5QU00_9ASCO|nr:ssDNA endodeoxyribonuclease [Saccharomycopsis crataegensis]